MSANDRTASRRRFVGRGMALGGGILAAPAISAAFGSVGADAAAAPANETLKTIHSLRTIHGDFSEKQVPEAAVQAVLEATVRAANASNMQSYSIIVTRDAAKIQKLTGYRGSCLLLYCSDYTRIVDTAKHLGYECYGDNIEAFVTSSTNTILAAQTAVIAAKSMGIDSLLTNGIHRGNIERLWEILDLPQKGCFPLIALVLGYPKTEPTVRKGRLKGPGVIHYDRYQRLGKSELDEIVRQHDDDSLHLSLNDEWKRKGYKHYLDWFYKDWMRGSKPTAAEGQMFKRLKKSGYVDMQNA